MITDIETVPNLLERADPRSTMVTAAALLDVLRTDQVVDLCWTIATARIPGWFSLTVTGAMTITPPHRSDRDLDEAFKAHQRRGGRAGPAAVRLAADTFAAHHAPVTMVDTPWLLGAASEPDFVDRFLAERVAAAVEQQPGLSGPAADWLAQRRAQLDGGVVSIGVGHRDLLALPGRH